MCAIQVAAHVSYQSELEFPVVGHTHEDLALTKHKYVASRKGLILTVYMYIHTFQLT